MGKKKNKQRGVGKVEKGIQRTTEGQIGKSLCCMNTQLLPYLIYMKYHERKI